jgi:hypothetical protein
MTPKEEGLKRVRKNNSVDYERLLEFAKAWVKQKMYPFTSEDLKIAFEQSNTPPRQPNIYGAAINALATSKLIYENGTARAKLKRAHGRLLLKWISHEYRVAQSEKPRNQKQINLFDL